MPDQPQRTMPWYKFIPIALLAWVAAGTIIGLLFAGGAMVAY